MISVEMHERMATNEEAIKELRRNMQEHKQESDKRFEKCEAVIESIHDLAFGVKQMGTDLTEIKADVKKVETKVNELENKPAKLSLKLWLAIGGMVGTGIVGYILALLGLGG